MTDRPEVGVVPILQIWGLVLVPVQGELDDEQWEGLTQRVLQTIIETDASGLILDVTGISVLDSHMVAVVGNLAAAAQLMGTKTTLVGMTPAITMTLVEMGIELKSVHSTRDLEAALTEFGVRYAGPKLDPSTAMSARGGASDDEHE